MDENRSRMRQYSLYPTQEGYLSRLYVCHEGSPCSPWLRKGFQSNPASQTLLYLSFKTVAALEGSDNLTNTNMYAIVVPIYSKAVVKNQTVWLEIFVCQNCSSWRYWLFICKITAIIWIEKIFLWKLKRKVGLPQIIMANVLEGQTNVLGTFANHSEKKIKPIRNFLWYLTWCSDYFYHGFNEFNGSDPLNSWSFELVSKTKTG